MSTYAVILAGGVGSRLGADVPKQFVEIGGRPMLNYSLDAFSAAAAIDEIVVITAAAYRRTVEEIVAAGSYTKVTFIVDGGATRADSTAAALQVLSGRDGCVLIHDAARPFLPQQTIEECIAQLAHVDAVATVVASPDTVVRLDAAGTTIESTLDRDRLRWLQTPQGFRLPVLAAAFDAAGSKREFQATDDFTIVRHFLPATSTSIVVGAAQTFKITSADDLLTARALHAAGAV